MSPEKLVRMATQIATFFRTQPGADPAERVAQHLHDFWDPAMRAALKQHLGAGGTADDIVRRAADRL